MGDAEAEFDLVRLLSDRTGRFRGNGADTSGEVFGGALTVSVVAGGAAVAVDVTATGAGEQVQYTEHGVLAQGDDGALRYWTVSSRAPFHRAFGLRRAGVDGDGGALAVFGWGAPPEATDGFREEVTIILYPDG